MSNPSYDLDDILNEITKRREENEQKVKAEDKAENEESKNPVKEEIISQVEKKPEIEKAPEAETVDAVEIEETVEEEEPEYIENNNETQAEEQVTADPEPEQVVQEEKVENIFEYEEEIFDKRNNEESVNLFELADQDYSSVKNRKRVNKSKKKWIKTGKGKVFISIIMVLVLAIAGTGIYGFWFVNKTLNTITIDSGNKEDNANTEEWNGMDTLVEDFTIINEASRLEVSSYRDMVKKWYYNGKPASSSNVLNVLLIGEDTRGDEIEDSGTRADSAIIASVNTQTGDIVLTSILRDSYAYWETKIGDESSGKFGKITEAMASGVNCYINCVENLFKVNIDNYAIVNFASFKKIIDSLGGVTITMTNAEIKEINNHPGTYGNVTINGEAGELLLNGEQALAYCRIRHIDSDTVRADRQKTVLQQLFKKASQSSTLKMAEVVTSLLPYVKTGFSKSEILSIGKYALSHGWLGYSIVNYTVPSNETKPDGTVITTCKGGQFGSGFYNNLWIWKVDYPLASQVLQEKIYDRTNVELAENRPSFNTLSAY
ncbi:MAG: LCP family protein [Eubacterium sp.]|nr:LCP family protein [Eubacterium sp.]